MKTPLKFGLLLPQFGAFASIDKCVQGAHRAEVYGFDSLWARDHLVFKPHEIEGRDKTHIESLILLSGRRLDNQKSIPGHRYGDLPPASDSFGAVLCRLERDLKRQGNPRYGAGRLRP